ncbi:MAG: hypothetical protein ACOCRX_09820 [Candidatus Woesearchaeota archaeon]
MDIKDFLKNLRKNDLKIKGKWNLKEIDNDGNTVKEINKENVIVKNGKEKIAKLIANQNLEEGDIEYILIGSDGTEEEEEDTALEEFEEASSSITPEVIDDNDDGEERTVKWQYTFKNGSGKSSIEEAAVSNTNENDDNIINRVTFSSIDNENHDFQATLKITVS